MQTESANLVPPLKWAGGKRWLFKAHNFQLPTNVIHYFEPFLGGGAAFFHFAPKIATLSDINAELVNLYQVIKTEPKPLKRRLLTHHKHHSLDYYYHIRSRASGNALRRAARTLYLNRTCWNGLYRVNLRGQFNVPIGTKSDVIYQTDDFERLAERLRHATLVVSDFEKTISAAGKDDFVFADPPYTVKHNYNGFLKYNESIFSWEDQIRLRSALFAAKNRGAHIFLTNADHPSIRSLYKSGFAITRVFRASVISGSPKSRGRTSELVIR
jgi:DNA adenine methylase